jgi:hypothetical protein
MEKIRSREVRNRIIPDSPVCIRIQIRDLNLIIMVII